MGEEERENVPQATDTEKGDTVGKVKDEAKEDEQDSLNSTAPTKDAKKAEANRKKKERQKAKAKAEKAERAAAAADAQLDAVLPSAEAVAAAAAETKPMRSERRHAGEDRGYGMFATDTVYAGEVVASTTPALSVVFDDMASEVCGFCFSAPKLSESKVPYELQRNPEGSFGLILDDRPRAGGSGGAALIAGVVKGSPNSGGVFIGDRITSIDGAAVEGGHEGAIKQLGAARERLGEGARIPCVLSRPSRVQCQACRKFCACSGCVQQGRLAWHGHECRAFQALPERAKAGADSSVLRLLLRFRVTQQPEVGEWSDDKESTTALTSLQRNPVNLDRAQLATLASLTGVTANDAGALISMVRTNACQIERRGRKAGCALSALVGWHNHDCTPNAAATVMDDGRISVCSLRDVQEAEEILISYVDPAEPREARRDVLAKHYGFECRCDRCKVEQRLSLKSALKESQQRRR